MVILPMPAIFLDPSKSLKIVAFIRLPSFVLYGKRVVVPILNVDKGVSFMDYFCSS